MDEAGDREDGADDRVDDRPAVLAVDDEHRDRAKDQPGNNGAATEDGHPVVDHARPVERSRANLRGAGAGSPERAIDLTLGPRGDVRQHRQDDRRGVSGGRRGERLCPDHETDEQQDRDEGLDRDDGQEQADQPEEADHCDDDAGRQRVADPAADGLPAGVADVDGRREGAAQE